MKAAPGGHGNAPGAADFAAYYAEAGRLLAEATGGRSSRSPDLGIAAPTDLTDDFNQATLLRPVTAGEWSRISHELDVAYGDRGFRLFGSWPVADGVGTGLDGPSPSFGMTRPTGGPAPDSPADLRVAAVRTASELRSWESCFRSVFGLPALASETGPAFFPESILGNPAIRLFAGIVGERQIGVSAAYRVFDIAMLDHLGTVPDLRDRGYDAPVIWQATTAWPERTAFLEAGQRRKPMYQSVGYREFVSCWSWSRPTKTP